MRLPSDQAFALQDLLVPVEGPFRNAALLYELLVGFARVLLEPLLGAHTHKTNETTPTDGSSSDARTMRTTHSLTADKLLLDLVS